MFGKKYKKKVSSKCRRVSVDKNTVNNNELKLFPLMSLVYSSKKRRELKNFENEILRVSYFAK